MIIDNQWYNQNTLTWFNQMIIIFLITLGLTQLSSNPTIYIFNQYKSNNVQCSALQVLLTTTVYYVYY